MTWTREVTIWCDREECGEWHQEQETVAQARVTVRRMGWTHRNGKDLCRLHSTPHPETT